MKYETSKLDGAELEFACMKVSGKMGKDFPGVSLTDYKEYISDLGDDAGWPLTWEEYGPILEKSGIVRPLADLMREYIWRQCGATIDL